MHKVKTHQVVGYRPVALLSMLVLLPLAACRGPLAGHDPVLVARLNPVLHRLHESGATITARVLELPSGRELYAANLDVPHLP
ncbi:MAG: hypothetical protein GY842_01945, partial [bacterium]|nr:hypothetical protein [bacterium]